MSEPAKKPGQQPESYDPRTPEIVSMQAHKKIPSKASEATPGIFLCACNLVN